MRVQACENVCSGICVQQRSRTACTSAQSDQDRQCLFKVALHIVEYNKVLQFLISITKTCLYNIDPLKPQFYIVKLGFTGVYISFLISAQNMDCGYSLESPRQGGSNKHQQSMF